MFSSFLGAKGDLRGLKETSRKYRSLLADNYIKADNVEAPELADLDDAEYMQDLRESCDIDLLTSDHISKPLKFEQIIIKDYSSFRHENELTPCSQFTDKEEWNRFRPQEIPREGVQSLKTLGLQVSTLFD